MKELRRILLVLCFLIPSVEWYFQGDEFSQFWIDPVGRNFFYAGCAISVFLSPFMSLCVIGFQIRNAASDEMWEIPTADSNPFYLGNPLPFGHFASQLGMAIGFGCLLSSLWTGWPHSMPRGIYLTVAGFTGILGGCGLFLGLLWTIRLAGDKVQPAGGRPKLFDW